MVVDDVEQHHQAEAVGAVDEALEVIGRAVGCIRRKRQDAIIAPVATTGELGKGHQLDRRDAQGLQIAKPIAQGSIGSFRRCRAHMDLGDYGFLPGAPRPGSIRPRESIRIDDSARSGHIVRLET